MLGAREREKNSPLKTRGGHTRIQAESGRPQLLNDEGGGGEIEGNLVKKKVGEFERRRRVGVVVRRVKSDKRWRSANRGEHLRVFEKVVGVVV